MTFQIHGKTHKKLIVYRFFKCAELKAHTVINGAFRKPAVAKKNCQPYKVNVNHYLYLAGCLAATSQTLVKHTSDHPNIMFIVQLLTIMNHHFQEFLYVAVKH